MYITSSNHKFFLKLILNFVIRDDYLQLLIFILSNKQNNNRGDSFVEISICISI